MVDHWKSALGRGLREDAAGEASLAGAEECDWISRVRSVVIFELVLAPIRNVLLCLAGPGVAEVAEVAEVAVVAGEVFVPTTWRPLEFRGVAWGGTKVLWEPIGTAATAICLGSRASIVRADPLRMG